MVALQSLKTLFTFFIELVNTRCEKSETLYIYLIGLAKGPCFFSSGRAVAAGRDGLALALFYWFDD